MLKYEQRKAIIGLKDKGGAKLSTSLIAMATVLRATAGDKFRVHVIDADGFNSTLTQRLGERDEAGRLLSEQDAGRGVLKADLFRPEGVAPLFEAVESDARFVMTHRDPADVMLSVADVYADIVSGFSDHVDRRYLGELNVALWSTAVARAMEFRTSGGDARFYDIDFRAMQADPVGEVCRLYDWLEVPVSEEFERRMAVWWRANAESHEPHPKRDPREFGLDVDAIRPRFANYVDTYLRRSDAQ
mgnify:CR=1 FL=1